MKDFEKKSKNSLLKAKSMIQRDLGWMYGYFDETYGWRNIKDSVYIKLDKTHLRRSTYAVNELLNDFQNAMQSLVKRPDVWSEKYLNLISILKQSVHKNTEIDFENLKKSHPDYSKKNEQYIVNISSALNDENTFLKKIFFLTWFKKKELNKTLICIEKNIRIIQSILENSNDNLDALKNFECIYYILNLILEKNNERNVQILFDFLLFEITHQYSMDIDFAKKKLNSLMNLKYLENFNVKGLLNDLHSWLECIFKQSKSLRTLSLNYAVLVLEKSPNLEWSQWWQAYFKVNRSLLNKVYNSDRQKKDVEKQYQNNIQKLHASMPSHYAVKKVFFFLRNKDLEYSPYKYKELLFALQSVPAQISDIYCRAALFIHWLNNLYDIQTWHSNSKIFNLALD